MRFAIASPMLGKPALFALASLAVSHQSTVAEPVFWGQTVFSSGVTYEGTFSTTGNWYADPAGTKAASLAPDTPDDDIVFNTEPANKVGGVVGIDANLTANSFIFNTSGTTVLAQDANRTITLGGGGITLNSDSGDVTFGVRENSLVVRLAASQVWTNHSAGVLNVRNLATNPGGGPVTLSLNAAGSGNIVLPVSIVDTLDDPLSVAIDSEGTGTVIFGAGSYSGGTSVLRGKFSMSGTNDTGAIVLGGGSGVSGATFMVASANFPNEITVQAGGGSKTLVTKHAAAVLNGSILLEDTLSLSATGKLTTLSGSISGTGALIKEGKGALILAGSSTFSGSLTVNSGSLTLAEPSSLTFMIGGTSPTSRITVAKDAAVELGGAFKFQISGTPPPDGSSWQIVVSDKKSFGPTFTVTGFTREGETWSNGTGLTFSTATGILSYKRNP